MKTDFTKRFLSETLKRAASISKVIDAEKRTVELAFSSETPVDRWGIREVLSHDSGACDLSRLNNGANLLFNHDPDQCLGVVESARIDSDGVGRAVVRFSKSEDAEDAWQDVQDGILTKVSVGYRIRAVKLSEEKEGEPDTYTVTDWQPNEISIVTIAADDTVGVGRNLNNNQNENFMTPKGTENPSPAPTPAPAAPPVVTQINADAERAAGRQSEQTRVNSILEAGEKYRMPEIALKAVRDGVSLEDARTLFLDAINKRNTTIKEGTSPVGLSDKEVRGFSMLKLIRSLSEPSDASAREAARFELEACAAASDKIKYRSVKGTAIPVEVLTTPLRERADKIISDKVATGYTGTGGALIETTLLTSSFIDVLRNKCFLMKLGVPLAGLVGKVEIPKQTNQTAGYWIGEDDEAPTDNIDFGLIDLDPKTVACQSLITRKMIMQPSIGLEALVRRNIALGLGQTIDRAGFYGDGTGNAPTGIKFTSGVNSLPIAVDGKPTFEELVAFETAVANANADVDGMSWVIAPGTRGYAKTAKKFADSNDSATLWEPGGMLNGYLANVTNQIIPGDMFFANWLDLLIGLWGGLEITVDPFTGAGKGRIRLVSMQDVDYTIQRAASFAFGS